jgi:hypothetical protein
MTRTTLSDVLDVLRWSIARSVALVRATDGSLRIVPLTDPPAVMPMEVETVLQAWAPTVAELLAAVAAPPATAQLTVYWLLERQLRTATERDELNDWAQERAAIREFEGGLDPESPELCGPLTSLWRRAHDRQALHDTPGGAVSPSIRPPRIRTRAINSTGLPVDSHCEIRSRPHAEHCDAVALRYMPRRVDGGRILCS